MCTRLPNLDRGTQIRRVLWRASLAAVLVALGPGCEAAPTPLSADAVCDVSESAPPGAVCGAADPNLPPEPSLPTNVCRTLVANKRAPDESDLDTESIQSALVACKGVGAVKLTSDESNNVFVAGHLTVDSTVLWIDAGTTLYASRDPSRYQSVDGNCGLAGVSDSSGCLPLLTLTGTGPGLVGDGVIDGQGGEPLLNQDYSWWDLSNALRSANGSAPNPALVEVKQAAGVVMYRITLHDGPKAHVKISANPPGGACSVPGAGFTVWGVTILTPSRWTNSQGRVMSPYYARNTDGFDPGAFAATSCGVMACNTISTGDDQIAIKAAHGLKDLVIAHNRFGTGHGLSIGSETNGGASGIHVYDLSIDGSSRWAGAPSSDTMDFNGIRVKSDESRGGVVDQVDFSDICIRDVANPIVVDSSYNILFGGTLYPQFGAITIRNVRAVTCTSLTQPIVNLQGFSGQYPAGPITLDNVTVDGITPLAVASQFADVTLGPGPVNFEPSGAGTTVHDVRSGRGAPMTCRFPRLPVPERPAGWVW